MKQKILLSLTLILMLIALFALSVSAKEVVDGWNISKTVNDAVVAVLYDDGTLIITGEGEMQGFSDYGGNNSPWRNSVKFAVIEEGVTNISNYAFFCCENLVSIEIPNGVTNIGLSAFNFCENLKSVLLPNTLETIEDGAFAACTAMETFNVPPSVKTIGDCVFTGCDSVRSVFVPSSVEVIGWHCFTNSMKIFVDAQASPSKWDYDWNNGATVTYGHTHNYINDECECGFKRTLVESWDWSETENDNVTVSIYDIPYTTAIP